jgi:acyl carrier protein
MTTLDTLQAILKTNLDLSPDAVEPATTLENLAIDSLALIEIMFDVEDSFKITVPIEATASRGQMRTIGELVAYIDKLRAEQEALPVPNVVATVAVT